jgi:hypothetical protein
MAHAQRPHFHFHFSRDWLKSHPGLAAGLKTFGIALGAATLAAIAAAVVVRLEWTLKAPDQVAATVDITAAISSRPRDTPRRFPAQADGQAKSVNMRHLPAQF